MIRKQKLAIVVAGALLLSGVFLSVSMNNGIGGLSSNATSIARGNIFAWYSNEQWTCDGKTVSRPVQCVEVKTGKTVSDSSCTDTKPIDSFILYQGDEWNPPYTCEDAFSFLHPQRPYKDFKENMCGSYPDVCRFLDKRNQKQPLYFSNARKASDVGTVTTKKGWHVVEYGGSIVGTKNAGMVVNSLSYEISNYNPDTLKIGNIKLYDGITNVDSLNQFYCAQEYKKNTKKLLITCSLVQPKKTTFVLKESQGVVPLYLLFDVLKSETSNQVMQLKFTGGVYNGRQNNWHDQTYPVKFKTFNETDYCGLYPERCEIKTDVGTIALTADLNNTENKDVKNILGGTTAKVFSVDIYSTNESVDVGKVDFTYSAVAGNLSAAGSRAELYLGDILIATAPNADITNTTITFGGTNAGKLTNLIIPQETKELKLAIISEAMGYEKAGAVVTGVDVTGVAISKATGINSGRDISDSGVINVATSSALFSIVPTVVIPTVVTPLSASSSVAKVKLTANSGANTITDSSSTPKVGIDSLTFSMPGSEGILANEYILYEEGKSGVTVTGTASGANVTFDLIAFANRVFTTDKIYVIVPTIAINETASLTLLKNGVQYDTDAGVVNVITALPNELNFGTRTMD